MPDYIFMLESRLSPEQLRALNRVVEEAQAASLNIYLVGGAVRDLMTGSSIRDLDFVVEGNPLRVARRLASNAHRFEEDERRRTAEVRLADGVSFSLEMARSEFFEEPGRPPEFRPGPILEDLRRRDFSVNAMGISLTPGSRGLLLDPTNGLADIENRELRVLHPYSFLHNPVRLLRLVRFTSRLGFRPDARTQELFETALEREYREYIQPESLGREMEQIAQEENAVAVLKALAGHELLAVFHPMLQKRKPDYDGLAKYQKYYQQAVEAGYRLDPFDAVLYYVRRRLKRGAERRLLRNLALKKARVSRTLSLVADSKKVLKLLGRQRKAGPRQVYYVLAPVPVELLVFILAEFRSKKKIHSKVYNFLFKYRPLRQKLPVRELQLMGVPPGPKCDQILEKYFEALLEGRLRNRQQQLRFLRKLAGVPKPKSAPKPKKSKKAAKTGPASEKIQPSQEVPPTQAKKEEQPAEVKVEPDRAPEPTRKAAEKAGGQKRQKKKPRKKAGKKRSKR